MQVTEVNIDFVKPQNGLVGFASIVLNDALYLSSIGIFKKLDGTGYRLTYPNRKAGDQRVDVFHPIRRHISHEIETAIFKKLKDVMSKVNAGYHCPDAE